MLSFKPTFSLSSFTFIKRLVSASSLSLFTFMHLRRKWQPTPVFLSGESQGQGSLVGWHPWGHMESDTIEMMQQQQQVGHSVFPRSKRLLISWLQSLSSVILEPPKIKSLTVSIVSLSICHNVFSSICHEVMGPDAMILVF